ncbi:19152_t:CDS:2 [Dentiscutata erythropus]|uniref:19152_t:CDS:1 n=1 Tax=Dentiscutata erythropus TaxID=1348616 RepID=A0A9N9FBF8_9GLOM|nr:19152_t:CDS:2 [Dentiscutata erythropus]
MVDDFLNLHQSSYLDNQDDDFYDENVEYTDDDWQWEERLRLINEFSNWTSGDDGLDRFIQQTQLETPDPRYHMQWIPFENFSDIKFVAKGGHSSVFSATWINKTDQVWDGAKQAFVEKPLVVALKSLKNSQILSEEFLDEFKRHGSLKLDGCGHIVHCHGVTRNPETLEYMMVMNYAEDGNLRHYMQKNMSTLRWKDTVEMLCNIAMGLLNVHKNEIVDILLSPYDYQRSLLGLDEFAINSTNDFDDVDLFEQTLASRISNTKYPVAPDIHPFAIYNSRFLLFPNLPTPQNSFLVVDPPITASYLDCMYILNVFEKKIFTTEDNTDYFNFSFSVNDNSLQSDDDDEITYEEYNTNYPPEFSAIPNYERETNKHFRKITRLQKAIKEHDFVFSEAFHAVTSAGDALVLIELSWTSPKTENMASLIFEDNTLLNERCLRDESIIVKYKNGEIDIKFVDFDWAGREGEEMYPESLNPTINCM